MLGRRSSRVFVRRPGSFVRIVGAFGESATDFVSGRPHHLRVMADFEQIVLRRAVGEIVFLQEPRLGGEHPVRQNTRNVNPFEMIIDETNVKSNRCISPWNLMGGDEYILSARSKVVDPSTCHVVVDQELALVRPTLSVTSRFGVPSLQVSSWLEKDRSSFRNRPDCRISNLQRKKKIKET